MALRFAPLVLRNASKTIRITPVIRNFGWRSRWDDTLPAVFRQMNRHMQEMERDMTDLMSKDWPRRFAPAWEIFRHRELPVNYEETQTDGTRKMKWQLDLSDYKPEEIKVTVKNKNLTINAKKDESDGKGNKIMSEYHREISLPNDANLDSIKSLFTDGLLKIEIDLPAIEKSETEIPVEKI